MNIHLHFSDGRVKVVTSWNEAYKYTWRAAWVYNGAGRVIKKVNSY
jgi:hypothetical protein